MFDYFFSNKSVDKRGGEIPSLPPPPPLPSDDKN